MPEMDAARALIFRPLVKGNEALGTRLPANMKGANKDVGRSATVHGLLFCAHTLRNQSVNVDIT